MDFSAIDAQLYFFLLGGFVAFLGLGLAIFGLFNWIKGGNKISTRMENFITSEIKLDDDSPKHNIIQREISGSLFNRTIVRWVRKILKLVGRFTPQKMAAEMEQKLTIAGHPANLHGGEFFAIRIFVAFAGVVLAFLYNRDFSKVDMTSMMVGILVILLCFLLPNVWLNARVRNRQDEIRRGLPDALDMLSVCASAGLGFDQSLQKISDYWETELGNELKRVIHEMEMGISRTVALKDMSKRLDVDDLTRFVALITQAEKVGMSYAEVLHSQALQMRVQRQYRAREIANKLPGKMIIPIVVFIFPAIMAVILGPAIPILMDIF